MPTQSFRHGPHSFISDETTRGKGDGRGWGGSTLARSVPHVTRPSTVYIAVPLRHAAAAKPVEPSCHAPVQPVTARPAPPPLRHLSQCPNTPAVQRAPCVFTTSLPSSSFSSLPLVSSPKRSLSSEHVHGDGSEWGKVSVGTLSHCSKVHHSGNARTTEMLSRYSDRASARPSPHSSTEKGSSNHFFATLFQGTCQI